MQLHRPLSSGISQQAFALLVRRGLGWHSAAIAAALRMNLILYEKNSQKPKIATKSTTCMQERVRGYAAAAWVIRHGVLHKLVVRRQMKHGPGWVVLEEGTDAPKSLVTILPSRRSVSAVAEYLEQLYVDRSSSIRERLEYKKSRKRAAYVPMVEPYSCIIHCGHNPWLVAFPARSIELHGNVLSFSYRLPVKRDGIDTVFESRRLHVTVDA